MHLVDHREFKAMSWISSGIKALAETRRVIE